MRIDNVDTRTERDVRDRVDWVFENYDLDEVLEMNDLSPEDVVFILYTLGHISEPESYFP